VPRLTPNHPAPISTLPVLANVSSRSKVILIVRSARRHLCFAEQDPRQRPLPALTWQARVPEWIATSRRDQRADEETALKDPDNDEHEKPAQIAFGDSADRSCHAADDQAPEEHDKEPPHDAKPRRRACAS
jgi:hypothetical protein